jgi:hypothetical protein
LALQGVAAATPGLLFFVGDGGDDVVRKTLPVTAGAKSENEYGCEEKIQSA